MSAQLDLFAGNQLDLLANQTVTALSNALDVAIGPRRSGGMPRTVEAAWERAYSLEVRQAFLDEFMAKPGEWMSAHSCRAVVDKYNISCCAGHAVSAMARAGMLEAKNHYYGSERPGPDYKGFNTLYRWRAPLSGVAHA